VRLTGPLAPLGGALIGTLGAAIYWLAVQIFPASVALILAMTATALLTTELRAAPPATRFDLLCRVLCLLIKFNALLALSAAKLPFAVPANIALGLIMICGYAASFSLQVAVLAILPAKTRSKVSGAALSLALLLGFAPALLLGIPGLVGLAAAIVLGLGLIALLKFQRAATPSAALDMTQLCSEACFYLGALASWRYV
jgi:hypothetical protein